MYKTGNRMKRVRVPGGRSVRKVGYNAVEIQKASHSLSEAVDSGSLSWLKTKFEHCPMEAVPNVWEGDEGMMKHVPKFPMPPCLVLPLNEGAEGSAPTDHKSDNEPDDTELFQEGDMEVDKAPTDAYQEFGLELKRRGMERKFWIKMAKVVMSIESLNQSTMTLRNKFCQVNMKIKKHDCQHLLNLYTQMQKIKYKLDKADVDYKKNEFTDLFVTMQPSKKTWFKRRHEIQGKLPNNLGCIVKKYSFVRTKLREIIHKNCERLEEFKDILSVILKDAFMKFNKDSLALKVFTETEGNKNGDASCVGGDKVDENTDEGLDEEGNSKKAELENAIMSKEDIFWENMTTMKKMMHKAATTLGRIDKATLPDNSNVFKKNGSLMCRQMLNIRKSIISFNYTLVKLKEEMQYENYEDKKLFTAEMLASEGIEGLTPDNSLLVVEALLNQLKDNYLRVQDEKYFVLEKFGYSKDVQLIGGPTDGDENILLVRICTHSRTEVDLKVIARLAQGQSRYSKKGKQRGSTLAAGEKTNQATSSPDPGTDDQQNPSAGETAAADVTPGGDLSSEGAAGNKDVNAGVETSEDVAVDRSTGGGDSIPVDEDAEDDAASDESSPEDSLIRRNVNSLSFFMSTLGPDALTVSGQSSVSTTEDFILKERQYWDRLQKLFQNIDTLMKQIRARATNNNLRKRQIKESMKALHHRVKKLSVNFELEKVEAYRAGYCTHVVYENLEYYPESSTAILVKSLDQIKQRINTLYRCYKETTEILGVPWMFKI